MNNSRLLDPSSSLSTECPHCGHSEVDDFEVIAQDSLHSMRCAECGGDFHCAVMECGSCGAECLFSWAREPAAGAIDKLTCPACLRSYCDHEASSSTTELRA